MLRIGEGVTITECCCHESVQPRHTGLRGELWQVLPATEPGQALLAIVALPGATCYAGTIEPEVRPAGGKEEGT